MERFLHVGTLLHRPHSLHPRLPCPRLSVANLEENWLLHLRQQHAFYPVGSPANRLDARPGEKQRVLW